jgi:hypothetical protein
MFQITTRIPAGRCPIHFSDFGTMEGCCPTDPIICAWFHAVREHGLLRGEFYTAEAICYWVRYEFDMNEDEGHDEIVAVIKEYAKLVDGE